MGDVSEFEAIQDIIALVLQHEGLKRRSISLVPTENILSPLAQTVLASDLANRYYLLDNTVWEYPQTDDIGSISQVAETTLATLYGTKHVNIRPLSGLNCMTVVLASLTVPSDTIYSLAPADGGHGATREVAERLGLRSRYLRVDRSTLSLDVEACAESFVQAPPEFIYIDHANMLVPFDLGELMTKVPPHAFVYYDCSHIMGLMTDRAFFDPRHFGLPLIGGSLHKTFPGPQKAALMTADDELHSRLTATTDSFVSSHHVNAVAALAVTALEMLDFGVEYSRQVRRNALALGTAMQAEGLAVQTAAESITETHQVWVEAPAEYASPSDAVQTLKDVDLVVNCARLPTLEGRKGLRFGSTEVTRVGMEEAEMYQIGTLVADCLFRRKSSSRIQSEVHELRAAYPFAKYCYSMDQLKDTPAATLAELGLLTER
ncbi:MAG: hypothetical protein ACREX3_01190 [Gammaproteobacteria bacterium]